VINGSNRQHHCRIVTPIFRTVCQFTFEFGPFIGWPLACRGIAPQSVPQAKENRLAGSRVEFLLPVFAAFLLSPPALLY